MFHVLAYGFLGFTAAAVLAVLWLGWEHRRDEANAEREKLSPPKFSD